MPSLYHRPRMAGGPLIATPAYSGVSAGYAWSIAGVGYDVSIYAGDCHVDDARNRLVAEFLKGGHSALVFIDADIKFEPSALNRLLSHSESLVGASYPFREGKAGFPIMLLPGEQVEEDGLLEVAALPAGFLKIGRDVLEILSEDAEWYETKSGTRCPLLFERQIHEGIRWGGDTNFCRKWRNAGGKVYADPSITLEHAGREGSLGHYMRVMQYGALGAGVMEIQQGIETAETFNDMHGYWSLACGGNWSAGADFLWTACEMARKAGTVIEAGSGLTTLVMLAAGAKVTSLEHDPDWARRTDEACTSVGLEADIRCAPLVDGWYQHNCAGNYGMALIDGPPMKLGDRRKIHGSGITADAYLLDDANNPRVMELANTMGTPAILGDARPFAITKAA